MALVSCRKYNRVSRIRRNSRDKAGTKHFSSGTKVFVTLVYGGMGHERILVIGIPRHSRQYIEVVIPRDYVENFRVQKVFKPALLKRMENSNFEWWGKTDNDYERISNCIEWFSEI